MKSWLKTLNDMHFKNDQNLDEAVQEKTQATTNDVGLINPVSGAGVMARENGKLEGYADYGLGFRFDPASKTYSVFASKIRFFCSDFKVLDESQASERIDEDFAEILELIGGKVDEEVH